jgi:phenylacetate-CoA ligase
VTPAEAATLDGLRRLLGAIAGNSFQRSRIAELGELASLADFTARVPLTSKAEIVADFAAHPPYGSNLTFPREKYTRLCQTSGTTARPLAILDTPESWEWMLGNWAAIYEAGGVRAGDRVYFAFSFGPFLGFWTAFEAAARYGCLCIPGGGLSSAARLRTMAMHEAQVLCCTPTYALHLAEVSAREKIEITGSVRKIFVAGEPGGSVPSVRARISEAWRGAEVLDHYGMTEIGPVAYQRSGEPDTLWINEDRYFAEVLDPRSLAPVRAGELGELILTSLGRSAWPLLRYRTGDLVRRRADGALEGGILGRADDMVVVRGVNIFPSAVDAVVRTVKGILEYRVHVGRGGELAEIALEAEAANDDAITELEHALTQAFTLRIPVKRAAADSLPRFELKARRWQTIP